MAATVTAQFSNPDPSDNPTTLQGLFTLLNNHALAEPVSGGPFTPYVISSTTPAVADQDKAWFKVDANGRPLEVRLFYNGSWRRFYTGKTGQVEMFSGNLTTYFDGTGLGLTGLDWDGWAICNGNNGTTNLSNLFIVGAAMDNVGITGYTGTHWQTNVTGTALQTGGAANYAIVNNNLPNMTVYVSGRRYSSGAGNTPKRVLVDGDYAGGDLTDPNPIAQFGANPPANPQTSIPTTPPFYALAYCQWIGY